jgi:hypothetical protein
MGEKRASGHFVARLGASSFERLAYYIETPAFTRKR